MANGKKKVLLIDDEPGFTRVLKLNLEKTGAYEVQEEHVGSRALAAVREFRPDIVLLDVVMPDVDGGTVVSQIRASEDLKKTKILFLTAVLAKEAQGEGPAMLNAVPCIAKPVGVEELISHIERETSK